MWQNLRGQNLAKFTPFPLLISKYVVIYRNLTDCYDKLVMVINFLKIY